MSAGNIVVVQNRLLTGLCFFCATSFAQVTSPTGPDTEYAPCLEGQVGTRHYESPQLASPDGRWRAYASVEATSDPKLGCFNTSTLFIKGLDDDNYWPVYVQKAKQFPQGNGLNLVSWSSRDHRLAVKVSAWQYQSDAFDSWLLIYDADSKRAIEPDLAKLFARKYDKKECAFGIKDVLGFDPQNRVLFEVDDWYEPGDDEPEPTTRCLGGPSVWALDIDSNQLELVKRSKPEDRQ